MAKVFNLYAGQDYDSEVYFDLNGNKFQNILVCGPAGSGKSVYIHNCIKHLLEDFPRSEVLVSVLNVAGYNEYINYSQSEIEVVDMPIWGSDVAASEVLAHLKRFEQTMDYRRDLFTNNRWTSYRDVPSGLGMPRIVLVVSTLDCFVHQNTPLIDEILYLLGKILRFGSIFGVHVITECQLLGYHPLYALSPLFNYFIILPKFLRYNHTSFLHERGIRDKDSLINMDLRIGEALLFEADIDGYKKISFPNINPNI